MQCVQRFAFEGRAVTVEGAGAVREGGREGGGRSLAEGLQRGWGSVEGHVSNVRGTRGMPAVWTDTVNGTRTLGRMDGGKATGRGREGEGGRGEVRGHVGGGHWSKAPIMRRRCFFCWWSFWSRS